jgi:hypothetical protein
MSPGYPWLGSLLALQRDQLAADVLAGITLDALAIPEVVVYTRISQTPVVTGLYTMLLPMLVFALLGNSRHLAATLLGLAAPQSPDYVGLTMAAALVVGLFLLLAAMLRLGFLADSLSRSALIGLLSGIGIQGAAGEPGACWACTGRAAGPCRRSPRSPPGWEGGLADPSADGAGGPGRHRGMPGLEPPASRGADRRGRQNRRQLAVRAPGPSWPMDWRW